MKSCQPGKRTRNRGSPVVTSGSGLTGTIDKLSNDDFRKIILNLVATIFRKTLIVLHHLKIAVS